LLVPETVALSWRDCPAVIVVAAGIAIEIPTFEDGEVTCLPNRTVADPDLLRSAILRAEIVTCRSFEIDAGGVYTPLAIVPTLGVTDHCTCRLRVPETMAVKAAVWPDCTKVEPGVTATETTAPGANGEPNVGPVGPPGWVGNSDGGVGDGGKAVDPTG